MKVNNGYNAVVVNGLRTDCKCFIKKMSVVSSPQDKTIHNKVGLLNMEFPLHNKSASYIMFALHNTYFPVSIHY